MSRIVASRPLPEPGTWYVPQTPRAKPRYVVAVHTDRVYYETETGVKDGNSIAGWKQWVYEKRAFERR